MCVSLKGFEDCVIFNEFMDRYGDLNLERILPAFTEYRHIDAHSICDLALYNFIEVINFLVVTSSLTAIALECQMRDLVNRWSFLIRKKFDNTLHWLFPSWWVPLYTSVTFSRMRYHLCIENKKWQDRVGL